MQGIYTYIPDTNYFPREYNVAAILLLLFMVFKSLVSVLNLLYFYISTFRSMCAVPNMDVFWSSLTSCFFWYVAYVFSKWLWNSPSRPYYYWYHLCFYNPHALYFYCKIFILRIFSPSFLITFLSPEIATSINIHVPFSLSRIIIIIIIIIIIYCYYYYYYLILDKQKIFYALRLKFKGILPKGAKTLKIKDSV